MVARALIGWRRYWAKRGTQPFAHGGFLLDPEDGAYFRSDRELATLPDLASIPCLVLLGEPGIGKTSCVEVEMELIAKEAAERGEEVLEFDLWEFGSEDRLVSEVFENDGFRRWKDGQGALELFLDSLDECRLEIKNVSKVLLEELLGVPRERLRFRIVCRAADWTQLFEGGLRNLWGKDNVAVYCLQPLTEGNVRKAAEAEGVHPDAFLKEIWANEATAFASRPVTLFMLLGEYRRQGKLPRTRSELYFRGCRYLCEELSESRRDAGATGKLDADQRLAVAARIAAVTVFCGRGAIWRNPNLTGMPHGDVPVSELSGGVEVAKGNEVEIHEAVAEEVLRTALFSSRGVERLGFAHQTYAEFLAAYYLKQHKTPIGQVLSLVTSRVGEGLKVVPQLHEVAAWLAEADRSLFHRIRETDPEVLLHSDLGAVAEEDREALVGTLLPFLAEERISGQIVLEYGYWHKLTHKGLANQLRPYIEDRSLGVRVRHVAVDIAEACDVKELQSLMADVALNETDEYRIRVQAAWAVVRIGNSKTRGRLKPLLGSERNRDPDDELNGCALMSLWPEHLTAEEVFDAIEGPGVRGFVGAYHMFLMNDLLPNLKAADLPVALRWTENQPPRYQLLISFEDVIDDIFLAAWEHVDEPNVLSALASATIKRCQLHEDVMSSRHRRGRPQPVLPDPQKRRKLIHAIVSSIADAGRVREILFFTRGRLVFPEDLPWALSELASSSDTVCRQKWAKVVTIIFDYTNRQHVEAVAETSLSVRELHDEFKWMVDPILLESAEAEMAKKYYEERQRWDKENERPLLDPRPKERVKGWLDRFGAGETDAWCVVNREMTLEPESTHYGDELESDLTALRGWKEADDETRARVARAAAVYLREANPHTEKWLGKKHFDRGALAGYRALRLLFTLGLASEELLTPEIWKQWASIVVAYPAPCGVAGEEPHQKLVKLAYDHAPDEIIHTLGVLIDKENQEGSPTSIVWKLAHSWDDRLRAAVFAKAKDPNLKPLRMAELLTPLLEQGMKEAQAFARSLVPAPPPTEQVAREKASHAAQLLMLKTSDAGWGTVWRAIQSDAEFGKELIQAVSHGSAFRQAGAAIFPRLNEDQLADLYLWLEGQFPHAEDPDRPPGISYTPGPRDSVADFRDGLLRHLEARGTLEGVNAIRRIKEELPHLDWLKSVVLDSQNAMIRNTWCPPGPTELLELVGDRRRRLVESGEQLLDVVIESLKRLELKLQGHTPHARAYWDKVPDEDLYRPVDENTSSDFVKTHLQEDVVDRGVIVNREVEVRRPSSKGLGERTDIQVDAVVQKPRQNQTARITCVIESKGCWNPELDTAMETQLRHKYLRKGGCRHGLYLVGWFNCDKWDKEDRRKPPEITIEEACAQFDRQAAEVSQGGFVIKAFVLDLRLP